MRIDRVARERVGLLDQQPVAAVRLLLAAGPHQREAAAQLVALEIEEQLPLLQPFLGILDGPPAPEIPDDHGAGPVVPLGDHAFEVGVLDRVVLHLHREPLLGRVERGSLGHRPREQHAAPLEAQVVVEPARRVLLHHEQARAIGAVRAERLGRAICVAFGAIGAQTAPLAFTQLAAPGHRSPPNSTAFWAS